MKIPFIKKTREKIPELPVPDEALQIADIIAPSFIEVKQNYIKIGEKLAKTTATGCCFLLPRLPWRGHLEWPGSALPVLWVA